VWGHGVGPQPPPAETTDSSGRPSRQPPRHAVQSRQRRRGGGDDAPRFLLRFAFAGFDETGSCRRRRSSAVEQLIRNQQVLGSSPSAGSIYSTS
jgi:hypothetical protein